MFVACDNVHIFSSSSSHDWFKRNLSFSTLQSWFLRITEFLSTKHKIKIKYFRGTEMSY